VPRLLKDHTEMMEPSIDLFRLTRWENCEPHAVPCSHAATVPLTITA